MSTVINTNVAATRINNVYNRNNTNMNAAMTRVATAQKINSAKDGAANWAISEKMRERIRANDQANQNVQNDTALLKTAQGGIDNTIDILKTLKERAINAANDSNVSTDRNAIATEVYQLVSQIDDNAAKVKFNGRTLLDGTLGTGESSSSGVTVTNPKGDKAVYEITGLLKASNSAGTTVNAASTDTLVNLVDSSGERILQAGDKITLSWKANGEIQTASKTIDSTTTLAQLGMAFAGASSLNAVTSASSLAAKDANGNALSDSSLRGIMYIEGVDKTTISDVSLSVTYTKTDGSTAHRTSAENTIGFSGVQQSYGPAVGSNTVYSTAKTASNVITGSNGNNTRLADLKKGSTAVEDSDFTKTVKFTVGSDSVTLNVNSTINDVNDALAKAGINYKLVLAKTGETIDGVTRGTGSFASAMTADHDGLYYIATNGETRKIEVTEDASALVAQSTPDITKDTSSSSDSSSGSSPSFDNGSGLTFHVGGEANFYMDMGIRSMTTASLLGNSASGFASMFTTKENARSAVNIIDNALQTALNEQTKLGAMESRMGYTSDNIVTMNENLEASDSVYRDADMAKEMTQYMKYSVLAQASQYMLAQAGQNAFSVLNLLNA